MNSAHPIEDDDGRREGSNDDSPPRLGLCVGKTINADDEQPIVPYRGDDHEAMRAAILSTIDGDC